MRIVFLNWSDGENDPFSHFNQQFRQQLVNLGHVVQIVELNASLIPTLRTIHSAAPIDLTLTWQGLGSALSDSSTGQTIWAQLGIPLVCLHGDHPCYNPANHRQSSRYLLHVYLVRTFARDANRLIAREWPALFEEPPNFFVAPEAQPPFRGDYFVLPKNLSDLESTRQRWKQQLNEATYRLFCASADAIELEYRSGNLRDHHTVFLDVLQSLLPELAQASQTDGSIADFVLGLGRELDQVHRNFASASVLEALPDVPIRVYGRGWDRFASRGNPNHTFHAFDRLEQGDLQYGSAFGIIDIAPLNGSLHDRTLRAMRKGAGFLISSAWRHDEPIHEEFADLFFSGLAGDLAAKVNVVRENPIEHRAKVRMLAEVYDALFSMADFIGRLRSYAADRGFVLPA